MILPHIVFCDVLPQWIVSSYKAAYHPNSNTIYTTKRRYLFHEYLHWFACRMKADWMHRIIDWRNIFYD